MSTQVAFYTAVVRLNFQDEFTLCWAYNLYSYSSILMTQSQVQVRHPGFIQSLWDNAALRENISIPHLLFQTIVCSSIVK